MWLNITSGDFNVNTVGDNNIIGGDILLNLNDIYFQKLFILRGKSHMRGVAGTKKPSWEGWFKNYSLKYLFLRGEDLNLSERSFFSSSFRISDFV